MLSVPAFADGVAEYEEAMDQESSEPEAAKPKDAYKGKTNKWVDFSGRFAFVSDYVYRGQTQTLGGPAAQGGFTLCQKPGEGLYATIWGSNVSNTIAPNGAGAEVDLSVEYIYKRNDDLSFALEVLDIVYPKAYASLPTRDKFDTIMVTPSVTYKVFFMAFSYDVTNHFGLNQNLAPTNFTPLRPNGNSTGSNYTEVGVNTPLPAISNNLKFRITGGYQCVRNYSVLNYAVYTIGLKYKLPENLGGVSLFANASATTANKKYYKVIDGFGKITNTVAPRAWVGISKKF
jgi:uncharacterized protein (TIGR02001 family)